MAILRISFDCKTVRKSPVGAGLLAIAVDQSTCVLAGQTPSPASRLLQGIGGHVQNERSQ
ncbi:hypothetical protein EMIT0P44_20216 [Pseudomonas sp. IT-P44]